MTHDQIDAAKFARTSSANTQFRDDLVAMTPILRGFARRLCSRPDMADDIVQTALMRGWAARDSFTPGTNFRGWMFVILRNQFYTAISKDRYLVSWDPDMAERMMVQSPSQQHGIHLADVERAMQLLPTKQREVLMLIGVNGASYEEAALRLDCAIGTVKSRLARGRDALAMLIDGAENYSVIDTVHSQQE
jgi:RNA polymerase sigma-70 factor, ECF subfamily